MADEILKRLSAVEKGLQKTVAIGNKRSEQMRKKIETLATKDDLEHAMHDVAHKVDVEDLKKIFVSRAELDAFHASVATKDDMKAVTDSVAEVAKLIKNFKIGINIGEKVFGFSGRFILYLGAFISALVAINSGLVGIMGIWFGAKVSAIFHLHY